MTAMLELKDVRFGYPQGEVLRGICLSIQAGTCAALVGPNGAGKTTLLRIVAGTLVPTSGSVLLDGEPLAGIPRRRRSCLIALVPQQLEVPFDFTVQQIVEQGRTPYLRLLGGPTREDRLAVDRALDMADCRSLRARIFNELSGGERQRVKIALGLAQQPRVLLLDEPTQNLDIGRQAELMDLLHDLREQGLTIFASIHDLHLVHGNFSTVHLLQAGAKLENTAANDASSNLVSGLTSGPPKAVLTPANLVRAFRCEPGRHPLLNEAPQLQETR